MSHVLSQISIKRVLEHGLSTLGHIYLGIQYNSFNGQCHPMEWSAMYKILRPCFLYAHSVCQNSQIFPYSPPSHNDMFSSVIMSLQILRADPEVSLYFVAHLDPLQQ